MVKRFRAFGIRTTVSYYVQVIFKRLSINYRLNQEYEKKRWGRVLLFFIFYDALRGFVDYILRRIGFFITSYAEIHVPLTEFALYRLSLRDLSERSVVYSFGVSNNIVFDQALAEKCCCNIYLFDPTPPALEFIESQTSLSPRLIFKSVGIWTETTIKRFYADRNKTHGNFSIVNLFNTTEDFFEAMCMTLEDIMKGEEHDHIDVLKLDIEGAALPVLEKMLSGSVRPVQILGELEMPMLVYGASFKEVFSFIGRKRKLFSDLKKAEYHITTYGKAEFIALQSN